MEINRKSFLKITGMGTAGFLLPGCSKQSAVNWEKSPAGQPYPYVTAGGFSQTSIPYSPDPLVSYRWPDPKAGDGLELYTLRPASVHSEATESFANMESLTGGPPNVEVKGKGDIMFDFGQVNAAWLEFDSPDLAGSVEMSISEYNEPAVVNTGAQNRIKTKIPVKYGDTYRLELNDKLYEGVRFGWIHVRECNKPWHITGIRLICQVKPVNYKGNFQCSDPLLNRIWYTGAYTVKLNLLNDHFGAILMERSDRHSWTGDAHPSQATSMVAFGNYDFVKQNINYTAQQDNDILSYSLYWVLSLVDYYDYTGDARTIAAHLDNVCKKLDKAYDHYGTDPDLGYYGWDERLGAGFENPNCRESQNAYKMLSIQSWIAFARMMKQMQNTDLHRKYRDFADEKITELKQDSSWFRELGIHAASDAINAGITRKEEQAVIFDRLFTDRVNRISYSPFNEYFIIQAMAKMKKYDEAISAIKDCWGGQINYGGTTFFEVYRPSWNGMADKNDAPPNNQCGYTSLAHPWGAGVTKWLSEEVLGIKPTGPGFSTYDIVPHLGRALTRVSGQVPTPRGEISASFNTDSGECVISAPAGTTGRIGIPKVERNVEKVSVNGTEVWDGSYVEAQPVNNAYADEDFVYLTGIQPGTYRIDISYSGSTPSYEKLPWNYPARFIKKDTVTGGNWGGVYGQAGYLLCNYAGPETDRRVLPSYISDVKYHKNKNLRWTKKTHDKRAPAFNSENGFPRNAGCIHTDNPAPTYQTMTVDITQQELDKTYQTALYFVDWDDKNRRVAVEMFDLNTKKLIAPVKIVRNFYEGKYLVYECDRSVRFRINHVRGENATLSGIFFD